MILTPNKWLGADALSLLLGGNESKVKLTGEALGEIANFLKQVNELRTLVNTSVDTVNAIAKAVLNFNPLKAILESIATTLQDAITDLKGTGVYFLDLNSSVPPLWSFGFTVEEYNSLNKISGYRKEIDALNNKKYKSVDDLSALHRWEARILVEQERFNNIKNGKFGGAAQYAQVFNDSLDDSLDFSRPVFSDNGAIAALFIMFGSSSLSQFFTVFDAFSSILRTISIVPPDGYLPLEKVTAKYNSSEIVDAQFVQQKTIIDEGDTIYKKKMGKTVAEKDMPELVLAVRNKEAFKIEEMIPIKLTSSGLSKALQTKLVTAGMGVVDIAEITSTTSNVLYKIGRGSETYFNTRDFICYVNASRISSHFSNLKVDPEDFYCTPQGEVKYIPGVKNVIALKGLNTSIFYKDLYSKAVPSYIPASVLSALSLKDTNVDIYWSYPKVSSLLTKALGGTYRRWEYLCVLKKEVKIDDPYEDLVTLLLNMPADFKPKSAGITLTEVDIMYGFLQHYRDKVVTIDEALTNGILGYHYALAGTYTVCIRLWINMGKGTGAGGGKFEAYSYPIYVCLPNRDSEKAKGVIARCEEERASILIKLAVFDVDQYNKIVAKYSIPGEVVEKISVRRVIFSNVAEMNIPIEYTGFTSVPPDWVRFPHMTMIFPALFKTLNTISRVIDTLLIYAQSAVDFVDGVSFALKNEADFYIQKVEQVAVALADVIQALSALSAGVYVMMINLDTGGIPELKKILAMSLMGNIEDVPWAGDGDIKLAFQQGPPPFGREDYVGGYALLGGTADFLIDILEGIGDTNTDWGSELLTKISGVEDTFSTDYTMMADASDINAELMAKGLEVIEVADITVPTFEEEVAYEYAYISDALDRLNLGDTPSLAGDLANSIVCSEEYDNAGIASGSLRNYDGSEITHPALVAFFDALKVCGRGKMVYAAEMLRNTGVRIPSVIELFTNDTDATAYNTFKLTLAQAMSMQLTNINLDNIRGTVVTINPFDNIADITVEIEEDTYSLGWNVAVYSDWDSRRLESKVYNDELENVVLNDEYELVIFESDWLDLESSVYNEEWEVSLFES